MPCYDPTPEDFYRFDAKMAKEKVDQLTAWLCTMCRHAEAEGGMRAIPVEMRSWWKRHKVWDAEREAIEKETRKNRIAKYLSKPFAKYLWDL